MGKNGDTVLGDVEAQEARKDQTPGGQPKGAAGRPLWAGRTAGWEPNPKFADDKWWNDIVPRIEVNPAMDLGARALTNLILTARVKVGGRRANREAAEFLRRQWGLEGRRPRLLRDTWEGTLRRMCRAIFQGAAVFEWVTRVVVESGRRVIYLTRLHDRHMSTIVAWLTDEYEQLVGVRQAYLGPRGGARTVDIPVSQLLLLSYRMRGATDFDGFGLWRPLAEEANDHRDTANLLRIAGKKFAVGELDVLVDEVKARAAQLLKPGDDFETWFRAQSLRAKEWMRKRMAGEESGVVRPSFWTLGVLGGGDKYDPAKVLSARSHHNEVILRGHNADSILVASSEGSGGYNAAQAKQQAAGVAAQNDLDWALAELDGQVNEPLLRMNFPQLDPDEYPRLQATGLRAPVWVTVASVLPQLAQAGLLNPAMRETLELPADDDLAADDQVTDATTPAASDTAAPVEGAAA